MIIYGNYLTVLFQSSFQVNFIKKCNILLFSICKKKNELIWMTLFNNMLMKNSITR